LKTILSILTTVILAGGILFAFVVWRAASSEQSGAVEPAQPATPSMQPVSTGKPVATDTALLDAVRNAPDVNSVAMGNGSVMILMPYGPCGIIYSGKGNFLWHQDPGEDQFFSDKSSAIIAAMSQCEAFYLHDKAQRDAVKAFAGSAPTEHVSPAAYPTN
jgi:hypothetical protein